MKKKILFAIVSVVTVISLLCLPVFATSDSPLRISEDYQTVEYNGKEYVRVDGYPVITGDNWDNISDFDIDLTATQEREIESIYASDYGSIIEIELFYNKGGYELYYYIREDRLEDLLSFQNGDPFLYECEDTYIDVYFTASPDQLKSNPVTMKGYEISYYNRYVEIYGNSEDGRFQKHCGYIMHDYEDNYYFVDFYQFGAKEAQNFYAPDHENVTVYKITDKEILSALDTSGDFIDIVGEGDLPLAIISGIILAMFLCATPIVAAILCLVFSRKARKPYRKMWRTVALLLFAAAVVFIITAIIIIAAI